MTAVMQPVQMASDQADRLANARSLADLSDSDLLCVLASMSPPGGAAAPMRAIVAILRERARSRPCACLCGN